MRTADPNLRGPEGAQRRWNPLTGEWVLVSPQRTERPWQGMVEQSAPEKLPEYDPQCYLCPGNARAGGARNPPYTGTFVFDNDFPALRPGADAAVTWAGDGLIRAEGEKGVCRVACFSPRHDLTLATMPLSGLEAVVEMWTEQFRGLGALDFIRHVQIFENRGAQMGASNPHPHCQIWATEHLPNEPAKEQGRQKVWLQTHHSCLLCDYAQLEIAAGERVVLLTPEFLIVVPFWAVWPFEVLLLPRRHAADLLEMDASARADLAAALKALTSGYDRIFAAPFPYSMGFHQAPTDGERHPEWHLHAHFYPPLLRSATIRKFMVGFEMLGGPQRDITPEDAAARLRQVVGAEVAR